MSSHVHHDDDVAPLRPDAVSGGTVDRLVIGSRDERHGAVVLRPGTDHDTVALAGEFDMATAPQLIPAIHRLLAQGRNHITIDLGEVTFMDAAALSALIAAHRDVTQTDGSLAITESALVTRLLELTGLTEHFRTSTMAQHNPGGETEIGRSAYGRGRLREERAPVDVPTSLPGE